MTKEHLEKREVFKDRQQLLAKHPRPTGAITPTRKRPRRAASEHFTAGYFDEEVLSRENSTSSSPSSAVARSGESTQPPAPANQASEHPPLFVATPSQHQNVFEYFMDSPDHPHSDAPGVQEISQMVEDEEGSSPSHGNSESSADSRWDDGTWIHCDVRYFDFHSLGNNFDVVMLDPPWRLRGNEVQVTPRSMFTNSSFSLNYNTLTNEEIMDLPVGELSQHGLLFLWVINSQLAAGLECMRRWGYQYANQIVWIKKTRNHKIAKSQGYYLLHSTEVCLIGTKGRAREPFSMVINRVANDLLFGCVRQKSRKPDEIYKIIEEMVPGARKIEIFARNHNIRYSWLSLGNQLGPHYDWDRYRIICDDCQEPIKMGCARYKSACPPLIDLCADCVEKTPRPRDHFMRLDNMAEEMVFHEYFECNLCKVQPIPGIRFTCSVCPGFDVCEACFDKSPLWNEKVHSEVHSFIPRETPQLAGGLPVHRLRCTGCHTFPVIGYCFSCVQCKNMNLCQKCFFLKKQPRNHTLDHKMQIFMEENLSPEEASARCVGCGSTPIQGARFQCNSCFNFNLCHECYWENKAIDDSYVAHKPSHSYTCITDGVAVPFPPTSSSSSKKHRASEILLESIRQQT